MCITTAWATVSVCVKPKWNMVTIILFPDIGIGRKILNGASAAQWCSYKAFVRHSVTVTAFVGHIQFSFQLPVVYYHHNYWYCGINHLSRPRSGSREASHRVLWSCVLSVSLKYVLDKREEHKNTHRPHLIRYNAQPAQSVVCNE